MFDKILDEFNFRIHILQNNYKRQKKFVHIHFKAGTHYLLRGINGLFVLSNISLVKISDLGNWRKVEQISDDLTSCASTILTWFSGSFVARQITPSIKPATKLSLSSYQATLHTGTDSKRDIIRNCITHANVHVNTAACISSRLI